MINSIEKIVCEEFNVTQEAIRSSSRLKNTCPTNLRHFFSKDYQCACGINAIAKNRITVKCNYID